MLFLKGHSFLANNEAFHKSYKDLGSFFTSGPNCQDEVEKSLNWKNGEDEIPKD